MEIVEVTWGRAFKVWWSLFWRSMLFTFLACIGIGVGLGVIEAILGIPQVTGVKLLNGLIGFCVGVFIAVWIVKKLLYKRYSDFSVVLIANESAPTTTALAAE